jgi:hypothetical protein
MFCAFQALGLAAAPGTGSTAAVFSTLPITATQNRERYDELSVQFKQRLLRNSNIFVNYTYSRNYTYTNAQVQDEIIQPINWGPNSQDQTHAVAIFGVFALPKGVQFSPILQAASARPYELTEGVDLNKDGMNNDRYLPCGNPANCSVVNAFAARGLPLFVLDMRGTKFFNLDSDGRKKIGVYVELYNLTNRANFGNSYNGSCGAKLVSGTYTCTNVNFRQPIGFMPGIGYPRQMQLGARFIF